MSSSESGLFREAVSCVFSQWPALQIAVENSFGGGVTKEKARWLAEVTADFLLTDGMLAINAYHAVL